MALRIENPEAERLAKDLAAATGESVEQAVLHALQSQTAATALSATAQTCEQDTESLIRDLDQIATTFARHATHDNRSADEIIGYDENGVPR